MRPTLVALVCALALPAIAAPTPIPGLTDQLPLAADADYDPALPTQQQLLGFEPGARVATPEELARAFAAWAGASPRARLFEHARSGEGRPLQYLVVTSPRNLARLDDIKQGMRQLADARGIDAATRQRLVATLPGVAWLGYSIHGDETSGGDAALRVAYHLLADRSASTAALLEELVVLINPSVNPDGRARWAAQLAQHRGAQPNLDDQSLDHAGHWPYGRGNHYLFDLNRDSLFVVFPETRGRIAALQEWNPLLFVDAHEMGSQASYLFSPAREPLNPNHPPYSQRWLTAFAGDQARAFDARAWPYFTGEWNDDWFPGYANGWASYRGAVSVLYEQAGVAEGGVRQRNGRVLSYREAVAHQAVSSLANLGSLRTGLRALLADYAADRARAVSGDGPYAARSWAIPPSANAGRLARLTELLAIQGIEVQRSTQRATVRATDQLGAVRSVELPAGTLLIANRQPEARLAAALLEFDPRMPRAALEKERHDLLIKGESGMYDWTAWNLTMMFGLTAYQLEGALPGAPQPLAAPGALPAAKPVDGALFQAVPGADDRALAFAARALEAGLTLRVLDEDTVLDGKPLARGSIVALRYENGPGLAARAAALADEVGVPLVAGGAGLGADDLADLGGDHFRLLAAPRVAVLGRGQTSTYDFGAVRHLLDARLGVRHAQLDEAELGGVDLRRYNVLVLPQRSGALPDGLAAKLRGWVEQGGTLIAIGRSAGELAANGSPFAAVRRLPDALTDLAPYQVAVHREWQGRRGALADDGTLWGRRARREPLAPWAGAGGEKLDDKELARRDAWAALFMPQGALLAARADPEHWLAFGSEPVLPVLFGDVPVLLAGEGAQAPVRLGVYVPSSAPPRKPGEPAPQVGWAPLPEGQDLALRMSGLLWPEAAQRLASAAYLTREAVGRGQLILFAAPPAVRGGSEGTTRLLMNALVLGPGLGADAPLIP